MKESVIEELKVIRTWAACDVISTGTGDNIRVMEAIDGALDLLKASVPVRHGRWEEDKDYEGDSIYICSECACTWITLDGTPAENNMRYCPRYGAKMDEQTGGSNTENA